MANEIDVAKVYNHAADNGRIRREVVRRSVPVRRVASPAQHPDIPTIVGPVIGQFSAESKERDHALEIRLSMLENRVSALEAPLRQQAPTR